MVAITRKSVGQYLREFAAWLHLQPFTRPLLRLAYSRKAEIAAGLTAFVLYQVPKLEPVAGELNTVMLELVLILFIWLFTSLGYVIEDAAAKKSGIVG